MIMMIMFTKLARMNWDTDLEAPNLNGKLSLVKVITGLKKQIWGPKSVIFVISVE